MLCYNSMLMRVFGAFNCIGQIEVLMFVAEHDRKSRTNFLIGRSLAGPEFLGNFIFSIFDCSIATPILLGFN